MSYRIKNYPYLVKIIFVDAYGMAFVSNNYKNKKLFMLEYFSGFIIGVIVCIIIAYFIVKKIFKIFINNL